MKKAIILLAMGFVFSFCNTPGETTSTSADSAGAATGSTTMSSDTSRSGSTTSDTSPALSKHQQYKWHMSTILTNYWDNASGVLGHLLQLIGVDKNLLLSLFF